jgi:hypothetical protein
MALEGWEFSEDEEGCFSGGLLIAITAVSGCRQETLAGWIMRNSLGDGGSRPLFACNNKGELFGL